MRIPGGSPGTDTTVSDACIRVDDRVVVRFARKPPLGTPSRTRTDTEAERRDDARRVRSALEALPTDQRRVIDLAYFGGFTRPHTADLLGLPTGTVTSRDAPGANQAAVPAGKRRGSSTIRERERERESMSG